MAQLSGINPALAQYVTLSPYVPAMGVHVGVQGPGLTLAVSREGTLNAVEVVVPAAAGWQPWFDQPEGQPMELPGLGPAYTQHIYLVDPATIK